MPYTEPYISCVNLPAQINGVDANVVSGGFKPDVGTDDMTNNGGGGYYEDVPTVKKATGKLTLAVKGSLSLTSGSVYPLTINYPAGAPGTGPSFSGNVRVQFDAGNVVDVTKGVKYDCNFTSQGAYVYAL